MLSGYSVNKEMVLFVGKGSSRVFGKGRKSVQLEVVPKLKGSDCFVQKKKMSLTQSTLFILLTSQNPGTFYLDIGANTGFSRIMYGVEMIPPQGNLADGVFYSGNFFLQIYLS